MVELGGPLKINAKYNMLEKDKGVLLVFIPTLQFTNFLGAEKERETSPS